MKAQAKSKKLQAELQANIVAIEDNSRRPRCAYFGEMLQMDASIHLWFGDTKTQLHIAVDDATGTIHLIRTGIRYTFIRGLRQW